VGRHTAARSVHCVNGPWRVSHKEVASIQQVTVVSTDRHIPSKKEISEIFFWLQDNGVNVNPENGLVAELERSPHKQQFQKIHVPTTARSLTQQYIIEPMFVRVRLMVFAAQFHILDTV
jgi:hypothetical protein